MKPAVRGEVVIALGYSEPDSGSDAAAARTRAVRDGDEWVINGEKMFTTLSQVADYVFLLTRTNPEAKKHRGSHHLPGAHHVGRFHRLRGQDPGRASAPTSPPTRTSASPTACGSATSTEAGRCRRRPPSSSSIRRQLRRRDHSSRWRRRWRRRRRPTPTATASSTTRRADPPGPGGHRGRGLLPPRHAGRLDAGQPASGRWPRAPWPRSIRRRPSPGPASDLLDIFGPDASAGPGAWATTPWAAIEHDYRHSQVTRIYAGTSEIHRSIIAEGGLGLPRTRSGG